MILMNDFSREPQDLKSTMVDAAKRVFDSGWYILGNELNNFEAEWAHTCGSAHSIGVGNGMDAIEIILRALDISAGDEVITSPMTAFATVLAIYRAGAQPVLADIDPLTGLLSPASVVRCISKKTKAIVLVHLYGQVREMHLWKEVVAGSQVALIEDCAQSHLASEKGRVAGNFGIAGAYSFYPTKNLGALGDAGAIVTNDAKIDNKARLLRNYGQSERYVHTEIGLNSRLDEMQAAILYERCKWLAEFTNRRKDIARAYFKRINNDAVKLLAPPLEASSHVYHLFVVLTDNREDFQSHLFAKSVQTLIHYPVPIQNQKPCMDLRRDPNGLECAIDHSEKCLSIPCHPQMSDEDVEKVVEAVNEYR